MAKIILIAISFLLLSMALPVYAENTQVPVPGHVTLVDLGAHKCIPCKMMAPILEKLSTAYAGQAAILFIDVWENPDDAKRFKIAAIPTQIFFNENGEEVYRHQGFLAEDAIVDQLTKMGVAKPAEVQ